MSVAEGLSDNTIKVIFQDSRGFIWIGTSEGLNRYDGRVTRQYPQPGKELTDVNINCIAEDADGNIWIGTENGLNKLDPYTETITHYFSGTGRGAIPYKWCNSLYVDSKKKLWLGTEKGLALYDKSTDGFINHPINVFGKDSRINKYVVGLHEDSRGRFWLATSYGIKLFDRQTKIYQSFHIEEARGQSLPENAITTINEDPNGNIWAGTYTGGIFQYNERLHQFQKVEIAGYEMKRFVISDLLFMKIMTKDMLFVAAGDSILCAQYIPGGEGQSSAVVPGTISFVGSLGNVSVFYTDKQNNLWWGGTRGLLKMSAERFAYHWLAIPGQAAKNFVFHIIPGVNKQDPTFYLSAIEGWWKYDIAAATITPHKLPVTNNAHLLTTINNWLPDEHGYWFTAVHGFGYYDVQKNKLNDLSRIPESLTGQRTTGFIAKDPHGKFWVTLRRSGMLVYDPISGRSEHLFADSTNPDNVYGRSITDLKTGPDGKIYFCANKLYCVDPLTRTFTTFVQPPFAGPVDSSKVNPYKLLFTHEGRLIVFARKRIYELKDQQLVTIYPGSGLTNFVLDKVVPGINGDIFITTSKTILKTDLSFSRWNNLGSIAGIRPDDVPFEVNASIPGKILLSGTGGLGVLTDNAQTTRKKVSPVIISRVKYGDKESFLVSSRDPAIRTSFKNAIEIEISPLNYVDGKDQRILYQLEGWDKEWKELSTTSPLRYEQLPPGQYKFKARSVIGNLESEVTDFAFTIIPPFYKTWWFIGLIVLITTGGIYMFYRYRLNAALKMERLRTRIATDLHDDIGATLSSISMYSETVKTQVKESLPHLEPVLNKMGQNSRDMVSSMSDIVWAINPENDDAGKLVHRMENHARDLCALKNIQLHFAADPRLDEIKLSLEQRKNIFLVFKEALNNALKYSGASAIGIKISHQDRKIRLSITDNGKGFDVALQAPGNGLKNMQLRAREIRASYRLNAAINKGTEVILECPL